MNDSKVVLITGVSSGIGRAAAEKFAAPGWTVFGTARKDVSSVLGFLPAPYMGLYEASKHAVEGLSESPDHQVRQFGIRVTLVPPAYTRTRLSANPSQTKSRIRQCDREREIASRALAASVIRGPAPDAVADTIIDAALSSWRMRRLPAGHARVLNKLRRFMPAGPVDASLRKSFGLA